MLTIVSKYCVIWPPPPQRAHKEVVHVAETRVNLTIGADLLPRIPASPTVTGAAAASLAPFQVGAGEPVEPTSRGPARRSGELRRPEAALLGVRTDMYEDASGAF